MPIKESPNTALEITFTTIAMARAITNLHIAITTAAATAPAPALIAAPQEPILAPAGGQYIATTTATIIIMAPRIYPTYFFHLLCISPY